MRLGRFIPIAKVREESLQSLMEVLVAIVRVVVAFAPPPPPRGRLPRLCIGRRGTIHVRPRKKKRRHQVMAPIANLDRGAGYKETESDDQESRSSDCCETLSKKKACRERYNSDHPAPS